MGTGETGIGATIELSSNKLLTSCDGEPTFQNELLHCSQVMTWSGSKIKKVDPVREAECLGCRTAETAAAMKHRGRRRFGPNGRRTPRTLEGK